MMDPPAGLYVAKPSKLSARLRALADAVELAPVGAFDNAEPPDFLLYAPTSGRLLRAARNYFLSLPVAPDAKALRALWRAKANRGALCTFAALVLFPPQDKDPGTFVDYSAQMTVTYRRVARALAAIEELVAPPEGRKKPGPKPEFVAAKLATFAAALGEASKRSAPLALALSAKPWRGNALQAVAEWAAATYVGVKKGVAYRVSADTWLREMRRPRERKEERGN